MSEVPIEVLVDVTPEHAYACWACHWRPPGEAFCGTCIPKYWMLSKLKREKEIEHHGGNTSNKAALKVLNKLFDARFNSETTILAMTLEDKLAIQGVTVQEIALINALQKSIKDKKVLAFLGGTE